MLKTLGIPISADKALDIAKTISTITLREAEGKEVYRAMLLTEEQRLL